MNDPPLCPLTRVELQRLLTKADPAALLVPPRILRRVIKKDRDLTGPGLQVPHRKSYVIDRDRLLRIADRDELGVAANHDLPETVILLPRPDRERLAERDRNEALLKYWRLLFHARVHVALEGGRSSRRVRDRIERIGLTEFDEATAVLRQEHFVLPPGNAETIYEEFAAVYLELRHFAPHALPVYFPACTQRESIEAILTEDVDAARLFAATRLEGAPDPPPAPVMTWNKEEALVAIPEQREPPEPVLASQISDAPRAYRRLLQRAARASARGNMVRSAIFRMRALPLAPPGQASPTRSAAYREMEQFSRRLQNALGYADDVAGDWRQALFALLEPAAQGIWPSESRMLYDLQKVCIDRERPVYAVDIIEWIVTYGRRPIKRLLPFHDAVLMVKHLRSAMHRLTQIRIAEPVRRRLIIVLIDATHHAEHRLRERLRPVLREALDRVGLTPQNIAEQVARDKVVEELIDRIVEHGFIGMGDLRDAIARNRLKLPDLPGGENHTQRSWFERGRDWLRATGRGLRSFFLGDQLIRVNRRLAADLDGVYHRGEIYLRWLQRFSALAFGTILGRLLTLYVALPFGCSIAVLKVWDEGTELWDKFTGQGASGTAEASAGDDNPDLDYDDSSVPAEPDHGIDPYVFLGLGLFFLALFHVPPFRHALAWVLLKLWRGLCWLLVDFPSWLFHLPWVERILQSRPWLFFYQFVLKPLLWASLGMLLLVRLGWSLTNSLGVGAVIFVLVSLLLNSRLGQFLEEVATDSLVRTWHLIRLDLVPGFVRWVMYIFRRLQEEVERFIYTVDEWLRFRPGDNRLSLYVKPVLGLFWFVFTYLFRVIFNVFVEPTFNPIKHFPVVTVTAKILAPFYLVLEHELMDPLIPFMGKVSARLVAWCIIGLLPGLAGFLVWELKENWRLYRANQAPTLRPEIVGHHGETVLRLMKPGFHSGTLPKLYARLRHGRGRSPRKQYEALHHLRERLKQFVERNLFAVLAGSKSWSDAVTLTVGEIAIATNRIRIELEGSGSSLFVDFEEHAGWLVAGLTCTGGDAQTWLLQLTPEQGLAFRDALAGFYKLAGVEVVREQIEAQLPADVAYDLTAEGLVVWLRSGANGEAVYPLEGGDEFAPRVQSPSHLPALPLLARDAILYLATPIYWKHWAQTWQLDHDGKGHSSLLPLRIRLLPH